ncbi:MAG: 4-alpha-glucanotransferase [Rhodomicrobiaceae bacterium]
MNSELDRLAEAHGICLVFRDEMGNERFPSDEAKRRLLAALGVPARTDDEVRQSLGKLGAPRCFRPPWLDNSRTWGITCQLYALRSARNWGMGDFEDLARLAELTAPLGADFIGINPLHALFLADPQRYSPYSPSSRRFLNPLYIAIDGFEALSDADRSALQAAREAGFVDYETVSRLKRKALEARFNGFQTDFAAGRATESAAFDAFRRQHGERLEDFALFEALSEAMVARGSSSGWTSWPEPFQSKSGAAVSEFRQQNSGRIAFHAWLQWLAHEQLANAQARALAAGMRIGLYLDLAVGVASDGADSWSEPGTVLRGARIGSPPDAFNAKGQDWQLAPISPHALKAEGGRLFGALISDAIGPAGAIRIDHAMALKRLYLIADGLDGGDGAYVEYPFDDMLAALGDASQQTQAIIIGEDLGTVPANFRETMRAAGVLGYRVLFFEREPDGSFRLPQDYERDALACISTHDLPTLRGWWEAHDLDDRVRIGLDEAADAARYRDQRDTDRWHMIAALSASGLLPPGLEPATRGEQAMPPALTDELAVALTRFLAATPCRLVAVQLEDLAGMAERANLPGTVHEHPNWRRKLPLDLNALPQTPLFAALTRTIAEARPRR